MKKINLLILIFTTILFFTNSLSAMPRGDDGKPLSPEEMKKVLDEINEFKTVEDFLEDGEFEEIDGFLKLYKDSEKDTYFLELSESDLNKEFLYFAYILNAPTGSGVMSGEMKGDRLIGNGIVLEFRKFKDGLGLYKKNTNFSNETENNISKRKMTAIFDAFIGRFKSVVEEEGRYLLPFSKVFLSEMLTTVSPNIPPEYRDFLELDLGKPDPSKTFVEKVKNYEKNTNIEVNFGFFNPMPSGSSDIYSVADDRYTSVKMSHLFVEMPDDNFVPRLADERVGFYSARITDLSSYDSYPARDVINKWRLVKKDLEAELSEPVEPIVFWVENSTPEEIKPFVVEGIERWNIAFERAGFKNAIVAKIQPDDAEWDAGDVQYNVVRWAHSPEPSGLAGYGPSIANPKTGEIIASDIMLEFSAIKSGYLLRKLWGYDEENDPLEQWIINLTLHEVGHTLALIHNFNASYLHGPREIHDVSITGNATLSSIMDYDPPNIAPEGVKQGRFFSIEPGEYDKWAIEFGYKPNMTDEERETLLSKSVEAPYIWNWAYGIDPRFRTWDLSNDVITYTSERFDTIDKKIKELDEIFNVEGETKHDFTNAFYRLMRSKGRFMAGVAGHIGGVYVTRSLNGQGINTFEPVPYEVQKEAMELIVKRYLSNDAWDFDPEIVKNLHTEKRLTDFDRDDVPQLHEMVLEMQGQTLVEILNPEVMTRLIDSSKYGNKYMPSEVLDDLFNGIFVRGEVPNTFKRNLQSNYVDALMGAFAPAMPRGPRGGGEIPQYDEISKAAIMGSLEKIQKFTKSGVSDKDTKTHFRYLNKKISKFLDS